MTKSRIYINESSKPTLGVEAIEELDNGLFVQC